MLTLNSPTLVKVDLPDSQLLEVKKYLTFTNKSLLFEYNKFKKNTWYSAKYGEEAYLEELAEKKAKVQQCILIEKKDGYYTYSGLIPQLEQKLKVKCTNNVFYPPTKIMPWAKEPFELREYQKQALEKLLEAKHGAVEFGCHRKGEKVLMYDGTLKTVESVIVGDQLMGPDSSPRNVLKLKRGVDSMYKIETVNGQTLFVNGNHILSLRRTNRTNRSNTPLRFNKNTRDYKGQDPIVNITVEEYLKKSPKFKHLYKLYSVPIEFENKKNLTIDPYFLGLLLGDGCIVRGSSITTGDVEIEKYIRDHAKFLDLNITENKEKSNCKTYRFVRKNLNKNYLNEMLKDLNLFGCDSSTKYIPQIYKTANTQNRLSILAGLIDTDGSLIGGCYEFISKSESLANDVCFIARSLGIRATIRPCYKKCQTGNGGIYHRVTLSGDIDKIPVLVARKKASVRKQKKNPTSFGFTVEKISDLEDHYGFELDKDHLYLADNFIVTHNTGLGKTAIILYLVKSIARKTLILAPSVSIADQIYDLFKTHLGLAKVGKCFDGKKEYKKLITIALPQTLIKLDKYSEIYEELASCEVFVSDESHLVAAKTLAEVCLGLAADAPYRFFFSGTQMRGDGLDLFLNGIIGPIVKRMTVEEGVTLGVLSKPSFKMFKTTSDSTFYSNDPNEMTRKHLFYNENVIKEAAFLANNFHEYLQHQVLILIEEIEQFTRLLPYLKYEAKFAHGPLGENKSKVPEKYWESDNAQLVKDFNDHKFPILVGTSCISTGTDIKSVKTMIYLQGGKSEVQVKQSVGRCTRRTDTKNSCNIIDFDVSNVAVVSAHADARRVIYEDIYPNSLEETSLPKE